MASGGVGGTEYVRKLRENLTCALCLDVYNHDDKLPKVIPCQHSFCCTCLSGLLQVNRGYTVPCPICRETFRVPNAARFNSQNLVQFPTNLALKNLIDVLKDEEEAAAKASKRLCSKHVAHEIVMVCKSCRVDVCAVCVKTGGHFDHALEDLNTAYEELENEINKELIPELNEMLAKFEQNTRVANEELNEWKDVQFEIIEGRSIALIAQICAWRDRNKASVQEIYETVNERLKEEYDFDSIEPIRDEIRTRQQASFSRLSELERLKGQLCELVQKDLKVSVPEVRLSDHVGIQLPDLVTVETVSSMPSTIEPNSGVKFELVASLSLIEQNWLESHPLNVYDSAGGTQNDTVLITDSALVKYELINCHFRQIWAKPLPRLTKNDKSFERTSASLYRVFITACGDVVLRTYPTTARFNPYLEENFHKQSRTSASASGVHQPTSSKNQVAAHANNESSGRNQSGIEMVGSSQDTTNINQTTSSGARPKQPIQQSSKTPGTSQSILKSPAVSHSSIYSGDYGQLVGVGDDRLLYWMRPVVQVYRLPGHQLLCELAGVGAGNLWTWVAVCVHPETSEMAVLDWGTKTLSVFSADGTPLSTTDLSYAPAPYKSCATRGQYLAVTEYAGRGIRLHSWLPTSDASESSTHTPLSQELGQVTTCQMGLADGEEITCCLGWGEEDVKEGRKGSVGILTLLVNGNGTKRLVAYRVLVKDKVEEEEQEATLHVS